MKSAFRVSFKSAQIPFSQQIRGKHYVCSTCTFSRREKQILSPFQRVELINTSYKHCHAQFKNLLNYQHVLLFWIDFSLVNSRLIFFLLEATTIYRRVSRNSLCARHARLRLAINFTQQPLDSSRRREREIDREDQSAMLWFGAILPGGA